MTEYRKMLEDVTSRCSAGRTLITARRVTRLYDDALRPTGLTITQFTLLAVISRHEPGSISELGGWLSIDRSTLSRNLKPLERAGLVKRGAEGTRRQRPIEITPEGQGRLKEAYPLWKRAQRQIEDEMEEVSFADGMHLLKVLSDAARRRV